MFKQLMKEYEFYISKKKLVGKIDNINCSLKKT